MLEQNQTEIVSKLAEKLYEMTVGAGSGIYVEEMDLLLEGGIIFNRIFNCTHLIKGNIERERFLELMDILEVEREIINSSTMSSTIHSSISGNISPNTIPRFFKQVKGFNILDLDRFIKYMKSDSCGEILEFLELSGSFENASEAELLWLLIRLLEEKPNVFRYTNDSINKNPKLREIFDKPSLKLFLDEHGGDISDGGEMNG